MRDQQDLVNEPGDKTRAPEQARAIAAILERTAQAARWPMWAEGALWTGSALGAILITTVACAIIAPQHAHATVPWLITGGGGCVLAIALGMWAWSLLRPPELAALARRLERRAPELRSDVSAALEFSNTLQQFDTPASLAMARAHIRRTAAKLDGMSQGGHLGHLLERRDLRPAALAMLGAWALGIAPLLIAPKLAPIEQAMSQSAPERVVRPVVSNLSATYIHPSYTKLPSTYEPMTSGNLIGLAGTEVKLQAFGLIAAATQVELVVSPDGQEEPRVVVMERQGPRLSARVVLTTSGTYTFRALLPDGVIVEDGVVRTVTVTPDRAPRVELLSHKGELEVSPRDVLELEYAVEDDFGVQALARMHHFEADTEDVMRERLESSVFDAAPRAHQGKVTLSLESLGMQPGDVVVFSLEATDNNTLTGPGIGRSEPLTLRVSSPEDKHFKNIEEQQQVVEALLSSLADYSEAPIGAHEPKFNGDWVQRIDLGEGVPAYVKRHDALLGAHTRFAPTLERMGALLGRLQEDPLMVQRDLTIFKALHEQLGALHARGDRTLKRVGPAARRKELTIAGMQRLATYSQDAIDALEKAVLRLDDLLASQKMDSVQAAAKEIKDLKARLKELLQKYKETKDPELKRAIRREIQRLRQRMNELMRRMSSQMKKLPKEHINMDAAKMQELDSDVSKLKDNFDSIEDLLEKDDIDGALEALERMTENLDSLTEEMDEEFQASQPQGLQEFDKKVSELMDEVEDVAQAQKDVEKRTAELKDKLDRERSAQANRLLDQVTRQMLGQLKDQERALKELQKMRLPSHHQTALEQAGKSLRELRENLEAKDIAGSLDKARKVLDEVEQMRFAMELSLRYMPKRSTRYRRTRTGMKRAAPMVERGQQMVDDLQSVMEQAQQMQQGSGDSRMKRLSERQRKVNDRAQQLSENMKEASKKFPSLDQQLRPTMERAQEAMGEAGKGLKKRRVQRALDGQRQALEQLQQMKQGMKQALQQKRNDEGRGRSRNREKVKLPGRDQKRAAPGFRDAIKDTMKEDRLGDYATEIEKYYESLIQ